MLRERFNGKFADGALGEWLTRQLLDQVSFAPNAATGTEFGAVIGDQPGDFFGIASGGL
ncbi:hypothetical protein D3C84_1291360 [compost metagenome]